MGIAKEIALTAAGVALGLFIYNFASKKLGMA